MRPTWRTLCRLVAALAAAAVLAACDGRHDENPEPTEASATLGVEGGTLQGPDGVTLTVPPGALAQSTVLRIARSAAGAPALPVGVQANGPVYEFTPHDLTFALPVTLRMPVAGAAEVGVLMASPGEPWAEMPIAVTGGVAEWQRLSMSWGIVAGCAAGPTASGCRSSELVLSSVVATPAAAMSRDVVTASMARVAVNDAAAIDYTVRVRSALDCTGGRLVITRVRPGANPPRVNLVDEPMPLARDPTSGANRLLGTRQFRLALSEADNGRFNLRFQFFCTRPNGNEAAASTIEFFTAALPPAPPPVPPVVTLQPVDRSVTEPDTATFEAQASGTPPPTVQWQSSDDGGSSWTDIVGATSATYTTPATRPGDNGRRLRAVFTNRAGSATSQVATLTVQAAPNPVPPILGTWGAAFSLLQVTDETGGLVRDVQIACGADGSCIAAWARVNANLVADSGIAVARYETARGWSQPVPLSGDRGTQPRVAVDGRGGAIVMWRAQPGGGPAQAYVRRFDPATGWGTQVQASPLEADSSIDAHALAMNGSGQVVAAFVVRVQPPGQGHTFSLRGAHLVGGEWRHSSIPGGANGGDLALAIDRLGRATLIWRDTTGTVKASGTDGSQAWFAPFDLSGSGVATVPPRLALDTVGRAYVAWFEDTGATPPRTHLVLQTRPAGGAWAAAIVEPTGARPGDMALASGPAGRAVALYTQPTTIVLREYNVSGGWGAERNLQGTPSNGSTALPTLVMDPGGGLTAAWQRRDDLVSGAVLTRSFTPALGWAPALDQPARNLVSYEQALRELALAGFSDGRAALLAVRTDARFLDELVAPVQRP